jgi:hypothetical protein
MGSAGLFLEYGFLCNHMYPIFNIGSRISVCNQTSVSLLQASLFYMEEARGQHDQGHHVRLSKFRAALRPKASDNMKGELPTSSYLATMCEWMNTLLRLEA